MKNDFEYQPLSGGDLDVRRAKESAKGKRQQICPRCENEEIEPEHNYCMICGLRLIRNTNG